MDDLLDHQLERLHRRRRVQRCLDGILPIAAVSLGTAATVVMLVRLALPSGDWLVPALAVAGLLVPLAWLSGRWRIRDSRAELAGHLDLAIDARGLAMALAGETSAHRDEGWAARLRRPLEATALPRLSWSSGRGAVVATLLLAIAVILPQAVDGPSQRTPLDRLFTGAETQLTTLEELGAVPEPEAEAFHERLETLKAHAGREGMDQTTWEALSRLEQDLKAQGGLASRRLAEALAQAEAAANPEQGQAAAEAAALAQRLGELAARAPGLMPKAPAGEQQEALAQALAKAVAEGKLAPEQLEALRKAGLRPAKGDGRTLDPEQAKALAKAIAGELARRAQELGTLGNEGMEELLAEARGPGVGEPDRGPGHTDHPQLDPSDVPLGQLDDLPPGARVNADGSITLAEQIREPDVEADALQSTVRAAAQAFDPAAADARRASLPPQHRAVVGRYFSQD